MQIVVIHSDCIEGGHFCEGRFLLDIVLLDLSFGGCGKNRLVIWLSAAQFGRFRLLGPPPDSSLAAPPGMP